MSSNSLAFVSPLTNTQFLSTSKLTAATDTISSTIGTQLLGDLVLNSGTSNKIVFNQNGSANPATANRSLGTKIVYKPSITVSGAYEIATGVSGSTLWTSVPTTGDAIKFYVGPQNPTVLGQFGIETQVAASFTATANAFVSGTTPANLATNGDIFLNNGTRNAVLFGAVGSAAPALTSRSAGTKLALFPAVSGSDYESAVGVSNTGANVWLTTPKIGRATCRERV